MNSIYDLFGTDPEVERHGQVLPFGKYGEVVIARAGGSNEPFNRRAEEYHRKWQRRIDQGTLPFEEARADMIEIFADTVILGGWLRDQNGEKVELGGNRAAVIKFLTDLPELFLDVKKNAEDFTKWRRVEQEESAKNSDPSCATD